MTIGNREGTGNVWDRMGSKRDEPCRDMVLGACWCPGIKEGPSEHQGGMWGNTRWLGPGMSCLAPHSTHRKAGGTRCTGVARLTWGALCRRRRMLRPLQCPSQVPRAHGRRLSPYPLLSQYSPAPLWLQQAQQGHVPLGDPSEGEERSCRGSPGSPAQGCAHLAAQLGRVWVSRTWAQLMGSVISNNLPGMPGHWGGPTQKPLPLMPERGWAQSNPDVGVPVLPVPPTPQAAATESSALAGAV